MADRSKALESNLPVGAVQRADDPERRALSLPEVIRRNHDALIRFLRRRLRNPADAEDVAQEAYLRMMRYEGSREVSSPSSMLFRVAGNLATDLFRAEQSRHTADHLDIDEIAPASEQPEADRELAAKQDLGVLLQTIDELPPRCRQVFLLSRVRHMTYQEIATHCDISVKMVEKHIHRALAACLKAVHGVGGSRGDTSK